MKVRCLRWQVLEEWVCKHHHTHSGFCRSGFCKRSSYFPMQMYADLIPKKISTRISTSWLEWLDYCNLHTGNHRNPCHPGLQSRAVCLNGLSFCHTSAEVPIWKGNCWLQGDHTSWRRDKLTNPFRPVTSHDHRILWQSQRADSKQVPGAPGHWRSYCSGRFRSYHYH